MENFDLETKEGIEYKLAEIQEKVKTPEGSNSFLVSLKEKNPVLYFFDGKKLIDAGGYCALGSGMYYLSSLKSIDKHIVNRRANISKKEAIDFALKAMIDAAQEDNCTGGHMDVAIITSNNVVIRNNYATIGNITEIKVDNDEMSLRNKFIHPFYRLND